MYFADGAATIYALNAESGKVIWKVHPWSFVGAMATGTLQVYKGVVYQPMSSLEEALAADAKYECCKFRGSVIALNAATGEKLWQTFTISEEAKPTHKNATGPQQYGPSGAANMVDANHRREAGGAVCRHGRQLPGPADGNERCDCGHGSEDGSPTDKE